MNVAVIGVGAMGENVIRHLQSCPEVERIFAYDTNPQALKVQENIIWRESLEEIWSDPRIKLVFVTAANWAHKDISIAAMRAGKAVMCEKPMATSLQDALEMVESAEKEGVFLQVGFELRYSKLYTKAKDWITSGRIGKIRNIQCNYICSEFWKRNSWRTKKQNGGSMFGEKLSHYIDLPRWWTGEQIDEVHAMSSKNVVPYFEVQDNYQASFKFKGAAVAHITFMMPFASSSVGDPLSDTLDQQKEDGHELRFLIMGTKGGIETDVFRRRIKRWQYSENEEGFHSEWVEDITWSQQEDQEYFHNTLGQTHDIVDRVRRNLPPMTPPRDSLETMKACAAVDHSIETGRIVNVEEVMKAAFESDIRIAVGE